MKEIARTFQAEVQWLAPLFIPPTPTTTPSSSTLTPFSSTPSLIPLCPFTPSSQDCKKLSAFSDEEWLQYTNHLKVNYVWITKFLNLPPVTIMVFFKARL